MDSLVTKNKSKDNDTDTVYDNIVNEYKIMDDAPYELDMNELRHMQHMERALRYIIEHIKDPDLSVEDAAACAELSVSYFEREFRRYFSIPFSRFVTGLRIRAYAIDMLSASADSYDTEYLGVSTVQSFSRAFSREIGVSPRVFRTGEYEVPDMPDREEVEGARFHKEYRQAMAVRIKGTLLDPPLGNDTYYMDTCAYPYTAGVRECADTMMGAWWYFPECGMKYVFGAVKTEYSTTYKNKKDLYRKEDPVADGKETGEITIQGGSFVVYTYDRPDDDSKIPGMSRILMRYIFKEWIPINQKQTNTLGCTYEIFDKEHVSIMVPLASNAMTGDALTEHKWSIARWADNIDDHITDGLSLESLAFDANYSPQNYRDVFLMYYGITPTAYIKKRRACLALNELQNADPSRTKSILRKYHFRSRNQLDKVWKEKLGGVGQDIQKGQLGRLPNLVKFYDNNVDKMQVRIVNLSRTYVALKSISQNKGSSLPTDIIGRILYWFNRDFKDQKDIDEYISRPEQKVFLWGDKADEGFGYPEYRYYVGSVLTESKNDKYNDIQSGSFDIEVLPGGKYAEFQTHGKNDQDRPREKFQFLTRMAFGGWINRNRWRVDFGRRTFVIWHESKLYFYVPVMR